jgi:hypothetical protein
MYKIERNISWTQANSFMFAFAAILDEESKEKFFDNIQDVRSNAKHPKELVDVILTDIEVFTDK